MLAQRHVHAAPRALVACERATSKRTKAAVTRGSTAPSDDDSQPETEARRDSPGGRSAVGRRQALQGLALTGIAAAASPVQASIEPLNASQREFFLRAPALFTPFYGKGYGKVTLRKEIVPGEVWALEQTLELGPLDTPLRCVVVRLEDGGLWVHAPVAPTNEFFRLVDELGPVKHIVVPTYALEHKVFSADAAKRWPDADIWIAPGQFSFPFEVPDEAVFGRPVAGVLPTDSEEMGDGAGAEAKMANKAALKHKSFVEAALDAGQAGRALERKLEGEQPPWRGQIDFDVLRAGRFRVGFKDVDIHEAAFFHRKSKTLIVTDSVAKVQKEPFELADVGKLLDVSRESTDDPVPPDTPEARRIGWAKTALLTTYFFPEHEEPDPYRSGVVTWTPGYMQNFDRLTDHLMVPPVVRSLLYSQDPKCVRRWVNRVTSGKWDFERVVPAHWDAPVDVTPAEFADAFRFLEDPSYDAFPVGDMRALTPLADAVLGRRRPSSGVPKVDYSYTFRTNALAAFRSIVNGGAQA